MATQNGHITSANNLAITTTKGDLVTGGSTGQASRFGVGLNGQILTADSSQSNGLKWDDINLGINYISDTDGKQLGSWATYANTTPASIPETGTGNSPTVTFVDSTDSSMRGTTNFLFTHGSSNQLGQGFSYLCNIDPSDRGSVIRFGFEYLVSSGSYADGDLTVWFQDATNSQIIQGAPTSILNSGIIEPFQSEVQVPISCAQMRVIVHVSSSTATAYTMRFDNFAFGPQEKSYGSLITDWVDFPSVAAGTLITATTSPTYGTVAHNKAQWRRVGSDMEIRWDFRQTTAGTAGSGFYVFNMPPGFKIDTDKAKDLAGNPFENSDSIVGKISIGHSTTSHSEGSLKVLSDTQLMVIGQIYFSATNTGNRNGWGSGASDYPFNLAPLRINLTAKVPILGWSSSSQVVSSEDDGRVVAFMGFKPSDQAVTANVTDIAYTKVIDSHGGWDGTGYTVKVPGYYELEWQGLSSTGLNIVTYVDGVASYTIANSYGSQLLSGSTFGEFRAGQRITFRSQTSASILGDASGLRRIMIKRLSGPSQIMAGEKISASYWLPGNFAASTTVPINFSSKETDTHGSVTPSATAWKFTAPIAATFEVYAYLSNTTATQGVFTIYKNGSAYKRMAFQASANFSSGSSTVELLAGEYIDLRPSASVTIEGGSLNTASHISIVKVG